MSLALLPSGNLLPKLLGGKVCNAHPQRPDPACLGVSVGRRCAASRPSLPGKHDVGGKRRRHVSGTGVAQGGKVYPVEQSLAGTEQDW